MDEKISVCQPTGVPAFKIIEGVCIIIFTIEYVCRAGTVHSVPEAIWQPAEEEEKKPQGAPAIHSDGGGAGEEKASEATSAVASSKARSLEPPASGLGATKRYCTSTMNLIDLVAILPWYMELMKLKALPGMSVIRVLRLARVLRVLKSPKFAEAVKLFSLAIVASMPALSILIFFSGLGIILFSSLAYFFEGGEWNVEEGAAGGLCGCERGDTCIHGAGCYIREVYDTQGMRYLKEASPFTSIPVSMYWAVVTMTTVGYGEMSPRTAAGKLLTVVLTYGGIMAIALPITVIGANFSSEYEKLQKVKDARKAKKKEEAARKKAAEKANRKATGAGFGRSPKGGTPAGKTPSGSGPIVSKVYPSDEPEASAATAAAKRAEAARVARAEQAARLAKLVPQLEEQLERQRSDGAGLHATLESLVAESEKLLELRREALNRTSALSPGSMVAPVSFPS